jgi:CHAT domain-containing protein
VYDLYRLRLPAELVTLSGCATGLNVAAAGDEILGISRGLLCAGARSLLLSLWDVHDEGTTSFMTRFYRARIGEDTASAVRDAMRETKARHPHPYYWAPFALVGKFRDH